MNGQLFADSRLPPDLDQRVRSELRDGERLLWVGQPVPRFFTWQSLPLVLFGIPWTAFAVFWMVAASGMLFFGGNANAGPAGFGGIFACFPLFGLPFVLVGLGMLGSPFWLWRQSKRTCYALTDRRAILWQAGMFGSVDVRSYGPEVLSKVNRREYKSGDGDLIFEEVVTVKQDSDGHRTNCTIRHGFLGIRNVRQIEKLLRKALLAGGDQGPPP